jgi:hypothetical protein
MNKFIYCFLFLVTFSSCKKDEKANWDIDVAVPLAYGKLTLADIVPDSLLEFDNLNNQVNIIFSQKVIDLNLDTLLVIPDTVINYSIKLPFNFTVPANTQFYEAPNENIDLNTNDVELAFLKIKSGKVFITLSSNIQGELNYQYLLPGATLNGAPLLLNVLIPAAPQDGEIEIVREIDLSGYQLDLTGVNGNDYNKLNAKLTVSTANLPVSIQGFSDSVVSKNTFTEIIPEYAKGYLGSIVEEFNMQNIDFTLSNAISGMIDFEEVYINFDVSNGFGVDARLNINNLSSINSQTGQTVDLVSGFIGNSLNLNRAIDLGTSYAPSNYNLNFNHTNSNIDEFIENWPNQLGYDVDIEINPLGNISNYNDFVYNSSSVEAIMNINIPLKFSSTGLSVSDTVDFQKIESNNESEDDFDKINSGKLYIEVKNSFPFSSYVELNLLDDAGNLLQKLEGLNITSGEFNSLSNTTLEVNSLLVIDVNKQLLNNLLNTSNMIVKATFNTHNSELGETISISPNANIEFKISAEINYNVTLK